MESLLRPFFAGFYVFSIFSVCWWVYLAYANNGASAYQYLSKQKTASFLKFSFKDAFFKHIEFVSILACFIIFLCALCDGFSFYFSWIPERYHLTLGDGSIIHISTILSCLFGICSAIVFGKWILVGICSYWEHRALVRQANFFFEVIENADNVQALKDLRQTALKQIQSLEKKSPFIPGVVSARLEICVRSIELRIKDIEARG